jgi:L-asparaginase
VKIVIIYTGGTIGCCGNPLTPLSATKFISAFNENITPIIKQKYVDCHLDFIAFDPSLDSTNLQPSDWCLIANYILQNYSDYNAFIVLHGTDSMAWSASAVSFLLTGLSDTGLPNTFLNKPVIFTGSQLPLFHENKCANDSKSFSILYNTDALQNILGSITTAYKTKVADVFVYFNNTLLRGNRAVKTNADEFNAFSSPNFSILGKNGVNFTQNAKYLKACSLNSSHSLDHLPRRKQVIKQLKFINKNINDALVLPFLAYPAPYNSEQNISLIAAMLNSCINQGIKGLILESYGTGNFPSGNPAHPEKGAIYKTLKTAREQGIIIINCSQVLQATVNSDIYVAGNWLAPIGAVGVADMTAITAFCKLTYLISLKDYHHNTWSLSTIEKLMPSNLIGEITEPEFI